MKKTVKNRLSKISISPNQSLGQNFLKNSEIAKRIIKEVDISGDDTVLEIGPGLGILTDEIIKYSGKLILIEKDNSLVGYLRGRYKDRNVEIIEGDVLNIDFPNFDKIVSNLPFNISTPIIMQILKEDFDSGVITFQKEYVSRMRAKKGDDNYSLLSVLTSTFLDIEILFDINRHEFYPPPNVDATVVKMKPKDPTFELKNKNTFIKISKELFNYRRKMIKNALEIGLNLDVEGVPHARKRVGNLKAEQIGEIVDYLIGKNLI